MWIRSKVDVEGNQPETFVTGHLARPADMAPQTDTFAEKAVVGHLAAFLV